MDEIQYTTLVEHPELDHVGEENYSNPQPKSSSSSKKGTAANEGYTGSFDGYENPLANPRKAKKTKDIQPYAQLRMSKLESAAYTLPKQRSTTVRKEADKEGHFLYEATKKKWRKKWPKCRVVVCCSLTILLIVCTLVLISLLAIIAVGEIFYSSSLCANSSVQLSLIQGQVKQILDSVEKLKMDQPSQFLQANISSCKFDLAISVLVIRNLKYQDVYVELPNLTGG